MTVCVFCQKLSEGDWERTLDGGRGDVVHAFAPLNPVTPGHMLVVPVEHVRDAAERPEVTAAVMHGAAILAGEVGSCNIITSMGEPATQTVFHLHAHVVPRRVGDGLTLPWTGQS